MRTASLISLVALGTVVIGCTTAGLNRIGPTPIDLMGEDRFNIKLITGIFSTLESKKAEKERLEYVEKRVNLEQVCPYGFTITDRKVIYGPPVIGTNHTVIYFGKCNSEEALEESEIEAEETIKPDK